MRKLLDVNVLLALAWPQHTQHAQASRWVVSEKRGGGIAIATCPIVQLGFVRVSMNAKGFAPDFHTAANLLETLLTRRELKHDLWPDSLALISIARHARPNIGPAQLTDFYLVQLAKANGGRLLTLDEGIKDEPVEIIPR